MTDREALFAAVSANPGDATLRLAVLDYLDGSDLPEDEDRAELIRVQTEYGKLTADWREENLGNLDMYLDPDSSEDQEWKHKVLDLRNRSDALLDAHPAWSRLECRVCGGAGDSRTLVRTDPHEFARCAACGGTGDLFKFFSFVPPRAGAGPAKPREVAWRDGFPYLVACHSRELYRRVRDVCPSCSGAGYRVYDVAPTAPAYGLGPRKKYVVEPPTRVNRPCRQCGTYSSNGTGEVTTIAPTAWALLVAADSPVTHFRAADFYAREFSGEENGNNFVLDRDMSDYSTFPPPPPGETHYTVPGVVFDLLEGSWGGSYPVIDKTSQKRYPRAAAAAEDLSRAFGAWVRSCLKEKK